MNIPCFAVDELSKLGFEKLFIYIFEKIYD